MNFPWTGIGFWKWLWGLIKPHTPTTTTAAPGTTVPPITTTPAPVTNCHGDTSKPICEPNVQPGEDETPVPYGMDLRFWVWSPHAGDVIKCGTTAVQSKLFSVSGKQVTGISKIIDGQYWCYKGYKPTSSSNPLHTDCTGTYQNTTYRLIYETRQV